MRAAIILIFFGLGLFLGQRDLKSPPNPVTKIVTNLVTVTNVVKTYLPPEGEKKFFEMGSAFGVNVIWLAPDLKTAGDAGSVGWAVYKEIMDSTNALDSDGVRIMITRELLRQGKL